MRRTTPLLVLAVACGLLASCGKGARRSTSETVTASTSSTTPSGSAASKPSSEVSKQQAQAFARAVNLTPADVPGFAASTKRGGNSEGEKKLEHQMLQCAGLGASREAIVEESSKNFQLKHGIIDLGVSSEVGVEQSAAQASRGLAAIRSGHVQSCFSRYLNQLFRSEKFGGATVGPVSIQSGTPPAPGTSGGFGWRVTTTFTVRGIKVPIYLDFLGFVDGPSEVTLLSSGLLRPFPATIQQRLFAQLLSRAKAHRP